MAVNIYINFDGKCKEAVTFYSEVFSVPVQQMMTFGEGPSDPAYPMPEEAKSRIMHTWLEIAGSMLMFSDTFPGMPLVAGNNMSLTVVSDDMEGLKNWFGKMKEAGGKVEMDLQETFWSKCYGSLEDKYGVHWQFSHEEKTAS